MKSVVRADSQLRLRRKAMIAIVVLLSGLLALGWLKARRGSDSLSLYTSTPFGLDGQMLQILLPSGWTEVPKGPYGQLGDYTVAFGPRQPFPWLPAAVRRWLRIRPEDAEMLLVFGDKEAARDPAAWLSPFTAFEDVSNGQTRYVAAFMGVPPRVDKYVWFLYSRQDRQRLMGTYKQVFASVRLVRRKPGTQ